MAKIVFKAIDATHSDPVVDARGCYKFGDPVDIFADHRDLGRSVKFPTFFVVSCPELEDPEEMKYLLRELTEQEAPDDETPPDTLRRKRYGFQLDQLPDQYRHELFATGYVEMPFYILEGVIEYKE